MTAPRSRSALQLGERSGRAAARGRCAARRTARAWSCRWRARTRGSWRPRARRSPAACRPARAWSPCSATLPRWTCSLRQTKARPASARAAPRSEALLAALAGVPRACARAGAARPTRLCCGVQREAALCVGGVKRRRQPICRTCGTLARSSWRLHSSTLGSHHRRSARPHATHRRWSGTVILAPMLHSPGGCRSALSAPALSCTFRNVTIERLR